jgi:Stage II sporulation protein E (SpoIIE)/7TM diverse intracellular signalling
MISIMRRLSSLVALFMLSISASHPSPLKAQTINLDANRLAVAPLPGLWRFHTGDNPDWAVPKFEDSGWSLLRSDQSWFGQGYKGYSGMAWYRFRVTVPATMKHVSIYLPRVLTCYELFANGQRIGSFCKMPPNTRLYEDASDHRLFSVPIAPQNDGSIEFALRVWHSPYWSEQRGGGPSLGGGLIGDSAELSFRNRQDQLAMRWDEASYQTVCCLEFLAAIGSFVLYVLRRKEREYLWFGLMLLMNGTVDLCFIIWAYVVLPVHPRDILAWGALGASNLASIAFYQTLLKPQRTWLFRLAIVCAVMSIFVVPVRIFFPHFWTRPIETAILGLFDLPLCAWIFSIFVSAIRHRSQDARLLAIPVFLSTSVQILFPILSIANALGWQTNSPDYSIRLTDRPFPIDLDQASEFLFLVAVFAVLILRFTRTRGEEERYASEVKGARAVQQFLIPEDLPSIPGLTLESDYRPATEVGGDFFQVIPDLNDGSALILLGDVAGKGLQAGMLATLLVGATRTAATFTGDPAVILSTLNNRLNGKGNATCLALKINQNGEATLVNAGHLPPYLKGKELPMEGALPLGTILDLEFPVLHFQIAEGDTLTLISDGVLEAQKPTGELFGFDRITEHLMRSTTASSLADAAQNFGQEDDITVLTIARVSARPFASDPTRIFAAS